MSDISDFILTVQGQPPSKMLITFIVYKVEPTAVKLTFSHDSVCDVIFVAGFLVTAGLT